MTQLIKIVLPLILILSLQSPVNTVADDSEEISFGNVRTMITSVKEDIVEEKTTDLYIEIASSFVGRGGSCFAIAEGFLKKIYNDDHFLIRTATRTEIPLEEAKAGDLIYYRNGGLGLEHWAIYLNEEISLQGNYLGRARITNMYLRNASEPIIYRISR